ncbi:hypothetical protein [Sphingopyxis terrae]|uniref:Uncharacterized protein n=1 Tax=Sphingopyxis terrae subsp. ummariensis TaxID=429001 RepID=A0A1Y6FUE0_9SPHN|nr:hypothetical protein [Sphingopyxis terrae]PCF91312.1 hypothetical protein CPA46_07585 [Sphingopyxis terrae subsp. ummariensis]SMQ76482.1 hypothetical protein SAMN06295984_1924 [Sphingopyxis terrae subsp. ummariensis]
MSGAGRREAAKDDRPIDAAIWDARAALVRALPAAGTAERSPLPPKGAELRPLRELLGNYLALPAAARDDVSLILENGQAFRADDIDALLARPDSPFR